MGRYVTRRLPVLPTVELKFSYLFLFYQVLSGFSTPARILFFPVPVRTYFPNLSFPGRALCVDRSICMFLLRVSSKKVQKLSFNVGPSEFFSNFSHQFLFYRFEIYLPTSLQYSNYVQFIKLFAYTKERSDKVVNICIFFLNCGCCKGYYMKGLRMWIHLKQFFYTYLPKVFEVLQKLRYYKKCYI